MHPRRRLIVFGKAPVPGGVKTRLAPALGPRGSAALYLAFLDDTLRAASEVAGAEVELWVPDAATGRSALEARYPGLRVRRQQGRGLGARLRGAFARSFDEGVDYVLVTGSDHPTLPSSYLGRALAALRGAHLVLGPTEDGGYYAVGLRRYAWPAAAGLFEGIPWSTSGVLAATRERAERLGLCHVELPSWYDVDVPEDLARLEADAPPESATARALRELEGSVRS